MTDIPRRILVLGGARSGKSRHAEARGAGHRGPKRYIATAEAGDEEMAARIAAHRADRGAGWETIEAPRDLVSALRAAMAADAFVLVDCVTVWLSNVMLAEEDPKAAVAALLDVLEEARGTVVLVSNEVGLGIVPDNALARRFRDVAGRANQQLAAACDEVVFVAAGLPLTLKG
ncbi:bifunctional adenosylcobinamide kinase/adenosylcobinamide-phosphate guanylyltransferase [Kaustia mangrovi]|uniref:Bifunctional adenosylcobalamin biosynthesis protein n=1 Tax=Kaustia mangrovi TaxID=2593653 RepID=A0A7S8C6P4_9HYPH|nr:bifunctional adenosylcobinamide kinase/adenosylcobinamide-phosphate guanylyltransferase [Kaustia mangrovi]QPC44372.1 bifunctional adenosylcobinamide kinase/adenosylcobinamide-phosphate guanylyltransferase [Kaustia mangrovi]